MVAPFYYRATHMIGPSGLSSKSRICGYTGLALAAAFDALVALALRCSGVTRFACSVRPVCSAVGVITFSHCKCLSVPLMISMQPGDSFCSTVWAKTVGVNTLKIRATVSDLMTHPTRLPVYAQDARSQRKLISGDAFNRTAGVTSQLHSLRSNGNGGGFNNG